VLVRGKGPPPTVPPGLKRRLIDETIATAGIAYGLSMTEAAERLALAVGAHPRADGFICWEALHDHRRLGQSTTVLCCAVGGGECDNPADYDLVERHGGLRRWLPHCTDHFVAAQGFDT
jgi:hypothetical protein